jgi:hypothetical protein
VALLHHAARQSFFNRGFQNRLAHAALACELAPDMASLDPSDFFQEEAK